MYGDGASGSPPLSANAAPTEVPNSGLPTATPAAEPRIMAVLSGCVRCHGEPSGRRGSMVALLIQTRYVPVSIVVVSFVGTTWKPPQTPAFKRLTSSDTFMALRYN